MTLLTFINSHGDIVASTNAKRALAALLTERDQARAERDEVSRTADQAIDAYGKELVRREEAERQLEQTQDALREARDEIRRVNLEVLRTNHASVDQVAAAIVAMNEITIRMTRSLAAVPSPADTNTPT